jgi:hypothetical protein
MRSYPLLRIQDPSGLTDGDWSELSRLQRIYSLEGNRALSIALDELLKSNRVCAAAVMRALSPPEVRATIDEELMHELEVLAGDSEDFSRVAAE